MRCTGEPGSTSCRTCCASCVDRPRTTRPWRWPRVSWRSCRGATGSSAAKTCTPIIVMATPASSTCYCTIRTGRTRSLSCTTGSRIAAACTSRSATCIAAGLPYTPERVLDSRDPDLLGRLAAMSTRGAGHRRRARGRRHHDARLLRDPTRGRACGPYGDSASIPFFITETHKTSGMDIARLIDQPPRQAVPVAAQPVVAVDPDDLRAARARHLQPHRWPDVVRDDLRAHAVAARSRRH